MTITATEVVVSVFLKPGVGLLTNFHPYLGVR